MAKVMIRLVFIPERFQKGGFNTTCLPQTLYANLTKWVMWGRSHCTSVAVTTATLGQRDLFKLTVPGLRSILAVQMKQQEP